jgi:hypothetical protein
MTDTGNNRTFVYKLALMFARYPRPRHFLASYHAFIPVTRFDPAVICAKYRVGSA